MIPVLSHTSLLKQLLNKFVNIMYASDSELDRMHDYLFSDVKMETVSEDESEIYETLDFLRDLAKESNYTSVEQLINYFDGQQAAVTKLIEPLLNDYPESKLAVTGLYDFFMKSSSIKLLAGHTESRAVTQDAIVHKLHQQIVGDISLDGLENSYQEIKLPHCLKAINVFASCPQEGDILPNSDYLHFKHYFKAFTPPSRKYTNVISLIKKVKGWFNRVRGRKCIQIHYSVSDLRKQDAKIKALYKKIFNSVRQERPIDNEDMKSTLSRFMLIAKLNNPGFRSHREASVQHPETKLHSDLADCGFIFKRQCYKFLAEKKWAILKSPTGHSWHTSDNPGFSIDILPLFNGSSDIHADPYWTNTAHGSMIYFPLSQDYCLRLQPGSDLIESVKPSNIIDFELSSEEELQVVNKLLIASKPQVVISPNGGIKKRKSESTYAMGA